MKPCRSAPTLTSYYPNLEHGDPTNSWWSFITLLFFTTADILPHPPEFNGTTTTHRSGRTTWPKVPLASPAEQQYFSKVKQSRNTSQITWRRCCKAPSLHSSHTGTRAMVLASCHLSTTREWPFQVAFCPSEHPLSHDRAQRFPPYLINPCFRDSCTRKSRDGQFHRVKLANNWIKVQ